MNETSNLLAVPLAAYACATGWRPWRQAKGKTAHG